MKLTFEKINHLYYVSYWENNHNSYRVYKTDIEFIKDTINKTFESFSYDSKYIDYSIGFSIGFSLETEADKALFETLMSTGLYVEDM